MTSLERIDNGLTASVLRLPDSWSPAMRWFTIAGDPITVNLVGAIGFLLAARNDNRPIGLAFIYALAAFTVGTILKVLFHRARPNHLTVQRFGITSYSFPSGHAFGSVVFYGLPAILAARYLSQPLGETVAILLSLLVALIGLSRVYLKAHYPSDVLGGWLFGGLALGLIYRLIL
jgi:undecaprenyl-diphosphatase